jgi:hypothetical protein
MSLTKFLDDKEVKQKFSETFKIPKLQFSKEIKLQPATKNYTVIGIAFDYLLRFYISRLNRTITNDNVFIAEKVVHQLKGNQKADCMVTIKMTKKEVDKYFSSKGLNEELLILLLQISHYDVVYRTGRIDYLPDDIGKVDPYDIIDLKRLYNLLQDDMWKCKETCLLNPVFGNASLLVSGADADLILDDMLIDIKVTTKVGMNREFFNQLMGYYTLHKIAGIGSNYGNTINKLGIYSARYGELISFDVNEVIEQNEFREFCHWFIDKAGKFYSHSSDFLNNFSI